MQYNNTTGWTKTQNELTNASIELDTRTNDFNIEVPFHLCSCVRRYECTHGDVLNWIQTLLIFILFVFVLLTYCKRRKSENNSAEIRIEDKDERLVLYFYPKNEKKKRNIEIHQAHCMCSALRNVYPLYTPLQTQNEVQIVNQTNENTVYIDVV